MKEEFLFLKAELVFILTCDVQCVTLVIDLTLFPVFKIQIFPFAHFICMKPSRVDSASVCCAFYSLSLKHAFLLLIEFFALEH